jgi:hypothetical protein
MADAADEAEAITDRHLAAALPGLMERGNE